MLIGYIQSTFGKKGVVYWWVYRINDNEWWLGRVESPQWLIWFFCQFIEIGFAPEWGQRKIQYLDMVPNQKDNTVSLWTSTFLNNTTWFQLVSYLFSLASLITRPVRSLNQINDLYVSCIKQSLMHAPLDHGGWITILFSPYVTTLYLRDSLGLKPLTSRVERRPCVAYALKECCHHQRRLKPGTSCHRMLAMAMNASGELF